MPSLEVGTGSCRLVTLCYGTVPDRIEIYTCFNIANWLNIVRFVWLNVLANFDF
mgnify:CR=1 FL=1